MKKSLLIATVLAAFSLSAAEADPDLLSGQQLRKAISGQTIYVATPLGVEVPIRYRANGSMAGVSSAQLAALAGEPVNADRGRWWVKGDRLCQRWQQWEKGRTFCYTFRLAGSTIHWHRHDGRSGKARISR